MLKNTPKLLKLTDDEKLLDYRIEIYESFSSYGEMILTPNEECIRSKFIDFL